MSTSFAIRIGIETPIALRSLLHLDGLLGALLTARGGTIDDIPLDRRMGVWQGSAGILETGPFGSVEARTIRIKHIRPDEVPDRLFDHLKPGQRAVGAMHPMRNKLTPYPYLAGVRAVWFVGRGDVAGTVDLLADARNLGAMGRTGWGRIADVQSSDLPDDEMTGVLLSQEQPARTIPLEAWEEHGLPRPDRAVVSLGRPSPPYWAGDDVPCVSPLQTDIMGTNIEIRQMIGQGQ